MMKKKMSQVLLLLNPWAAADSASNALKTPAINIAVAYDLFLRWAGFIVFLLLNFLQKVNNIIGFHHMINLR